MKRTIFAAVLGFTAVVMLWTAECGQAQVPEPTVIPDNLGQHVDEKFIGLLSWSKTLNTQAQSWNEICAENPDSEGCQLIRTRLEEGFRAFIQAAAGYTTPGTDCRADLRRRIVAFQTRLLQWNLDYAGKPATEAARTESDAVHRQEDELMADMTNCVDKKL